MYREREREIERDIHVYMHACLRRSRGRGICGICGMCGCVLYGANLGHKGDLGGTTCLTLLV